MRETLERDVAAFSKCAAAAAVANAALVDALSERTVDTTASFRVICGGATAGAASATAGAAAAASEDALKRGDTAGAERAASWAGEAREVGVAAGAASTAWHAIDEHSVAVEAGSKNLPPPPRTRRAARGDGEPLPQRRAAFNGDNLKQQLRLRNDGARGGEPGEVPVERGYGDASGLRNTIVIDVVAPRLNSEQDGICVEEDAVAWASHASHGFESERRIMMVGLPPPTQPCADGARLPAPPSAPSSQSQCPEVGSVEIAEAAAEVAEVARVVHEAVAIEQAAARAASVAFCSSAAATLRMRSYAEAKVAMAEAVAVAVAERAATAAPSGALQSSINARIYTLRRERQRDSRAWRRARRRRAALLRRCRHSATPPRLARLLFACLLVSHPTAHNNCGMTTATNRCSLLMLTRVTLTGRL